jgi:hypothetical protein
LAPRPFDFHSSDHDFVLAFDGGVAAEPKHRNNDHAVLDCTTRIEQLRNILRATFESNVVVDG